MSIPICTMRFKKLLDRPGSLRSTGRFIHDYIIKMWESHDVVQLDFEHETVASGSLFDEFAKLYIEHPKEDVKRRLHFINIDPWDERLIIHLIQLRLEQKKQAS